MKILILLFCVCIAAFSQGYVGLFGTVGQTTTKEETAYVTTTTKEDFNAQGIKIGRLGSDIRLELSGERLSALKQQETKGSLVLLHTDVLIGGYAYKQPFVPYLGIGYGVMTISDPVKEFSAQALSARVGALLHLGSNHYVEVGYRHVKAFQFDTAITEKRYNSWTIGYNRHF